MITAALIPEQKAVHYRRTTALRWACGTILIVTIVIVTPIALAFSHTTSHLGTVGTFITNVASGIVIAALFLGLVAMIPLLALIGTVCAIVLALFNKDTFSSYTFWATGGVLSIITVVLFVIFWPMITGSGTMGS
jgi:hypothetical protein